MKKILLLFAAAICAVASWADDVVTAKYNGNKLDVELTNTTTFLAFQMDIDLPAGVTVQNIESNLARLEQGANVNIGGVDTETPFTIAHNIIDAENNVLRVIAYNLGNHEIKGAEGKLFTVNLSGAVSEASISNILFVDDELAEQTLANAVAIPGRELGDVDGINGVTVADAILVLQMVAKKVAETPAADIDGVNGVTVADAIAVLKIIAKK